MSIIRAPRKTGNFYILDKRISEDQRLTWAARGLLIYLLGKPDHWRVSPAALRNETSASRKPTGRDGVYALLDELIQAGYVTRTQERLSSGHLSEVHYMVSETAATAADDEEPPPASPLPALPYTAQPYPANPTLVRTDRSKDLQKGRKEGAAPVQKPVQPAPAAPVPPPPPPPPPPVEKEQPEQPTAPAPVDTLAPLVDRINAQRANNGKQPYTSADIAGLHEQAAKAGISAEQAARWVLERPGRNFFQASYYTPAPVPVPQPAPMPAPMPAPEKTPEEQAAIEAAARAAKDRVAKLVSEMRAKPKAKK